MAWSPKEGRHVEADVCWFHVTLNGEYVDVFLDKTPYKYMAEPISPDISIDFKELDKEFPRLKCNRIYITTSDVDFLYKKKFFRRFRKILSKIDSNWVGEKTPPIHLLPEYPKEIKPEIYLKRR
ncbi:hypothetical protein J7J18_02025 [bacterium]|nr:hypothetical protein [bacterium]